MAMGLRKWPGIGLNTDCIYAVFVVLFFSAAAGDDCLIEIHPPIVVVRYGDPASANCTVSTDHYGMGWVAQIGAVDSTVNVQFVTWEVKSLTAWDIRPQCYVNTKRKQCKGLLPVTVYKPPDSVSVSSINSPDSMVEGSQYQLKCEVQNIAPVRNLTVKWYRGDVLIQETSNYEIENGTSDEVKSPVNVSSTLLISPNRADNGAKYSCGAKLDLGPEGPQPNIESKSPPLSITVFYKPSIKAIPKPFLEISGDSDVLNCTADGNPRPDVDWIFKGKELQSKDGIYTLSKADDEGNYTCRAINSVGSQEVVVQVVYTASHTIFWIIIGFGVVVALVLIIGCIVKKWRSRRNTVV